MRPGRRPVFETYSQPGVDSSRARANAVMFLTNARDISGVSVSSLARQYRLKEATARELLCAEQARRARHG